ncbi:MAG: hypothetical protein EPN97_15325 [Alphaproteobacteria bacterium]|nr:MAG: hypothetical protein EPN97_15325 [Alphaproteobacteria bacterium]
MDGFTTKKIEDDTPSSESPTAQFLQKPPRPSLKSIFGKAAAIASLAGTLLFYSLGFQISKAYYNDWQDSKHGVTQSQSWDQKSPTDNLPWGAAGGSLLLAFGAGAAGIAAGRSRRKEMKDYYASNYQGGSSAYYNSYGYNDNWFFWYWMGRSSGGGGGSWGGSSSSGDNKGLAFVFVAAAAVVLAASASVVSYEALHKNFGGQGVKPKKFDSETHKFTL